MFEVPDAKRVRRDELFGSGGSDRDSSPDTADEAEAEAKAQLLNAKLSSLLSLKFEFDGGVAEDDKATPAVKEEKTQKKKKEETKQTSGDEDPSSDDESDSDDDTSMQDQSPQEEEPEEAPEFEFRLFSTSTPSKIVLPSKEEEEGAGETVIADRPLSYYIRGELTPEQKEQFEAAAVTTQDIFNWAKQRAWGLEVPWRVKTIIVSVKGKGAEGAENLYGQQIVTGTEVQQQQAAGGEQQHPEKKKKKRLGKKGRIAFRVKEKARKEKEEVEQKKKMTKEEHLKEKKKRLNREKKLKRRQKEKEKKMAGKAESSVGDAMSAVGQDSDSESEKDHNMEE